MNIYFQIGYNEVISVWETRFEEILTSSEYLEDKGEGWGSTFWGLFKRNSTLELEDGYKDSTIG